MMEQVRRLAGEAGRDPEALELLVWAFVGIQDRPAGEDRPDFVGSLEEVQQDVATVRGLGATEIIFAPGYSTGDLQLDEYMGALEQLRELG
jgi:hypothetical protein